MHISSDPKMLYIFIFYFFIAKYIFTGFYFVFAMMFKSYYIFLFKCSNRSINEFWVKSKIHRTQKASVIEYTNEWL